MTSDRKIRGVLSIALAGLAATAGSALWLLASYAPDSTPALVMVGLPIMIWPFVGCGMLLAIVGFVSAIGGSHHLALFTAALGLASGFAGAVLDQTMIQLAIRESGGVGFLSVTGAAHAESLLVMALGFFAAVVSLGPLTVRRGRDVPGTT